LPGKQPSGRTYASGRGAKLAIGKSARVQVSSNLEDLAFEPVTALAPLVESRRMSSTDLTKMYLARLKRYGDPLHCVITLTEELALSQAANADREIKAGRYRGPLHGIPWGAKDLLATKGIRTTWGAKPYENPRARHEVAHNESDARELGTENSELTTRIEFPVPSSRFSVSRRSTSRSSLS
jgi:hypothetical protein